MKKNIVRVLALVLVAAMLFAFASCTTNLNIRFVDKDGNDINIGAIAPATNAPDTTAAPDTPTQPPVTNAPESTTAAPESTTAAPSGDTTTAAPDTTAAPTPDTTAAPTPDTTAAPTPTSTVPSTKDEIVAFYAKGVNDIKNNASAGFNKKEYQTMGELNITGIGAVDNAIKGVAGNYFKGEDQVDLQVAAKGSDEAKSKMLGWKLADPSKVVSAKLEQAGGNYNITIVMADEDTPHKGGASHLDQVGSVLLWEDIDSELQNVSILKGYEDVHVKYTNYTITATMTPDGKFTSIKHHTDVKIEIGSAKILVATLKNKTVALENTVIFSDFAY